MKIAVYGSLKKGFHNHALLERNGATKVSTERINGFIMHSMGFFPAIVPGDGEVTVEVYEAPDSAMPSLDRLEGYPSLYDRKEVSTSVGPAWIYFMQNNEGPIVQGGCW
jgi:gamma-glutamylcyclotransferase (GGCT)/AIG2-like uncharacterized protein YtfP